jgi:selenocysteine lyase/cysteine desulfurase
VRDGGVDPHEIAAAIDEDTAIASVTHGYYQNGALLDPRPTVEAARRLGALTFVDAYQTLGALPVDVKEMGVDALASGNMKFLMGVPGIAFLYVRREVAERLEPAVTGWFGRSEPFAFQPRNVDWAPGARRFDTGTPPVLAAYVARAGMELLEDVGLDAIGRWNRVLSERLSEGGLERGFDLMSPRDPGARTPTTAFRVADSHRVEHRMMERGVIPSARGPAIRLAPHYYSTLDDVDRALDTLASVLSGESA